MEWQAVKGMVTGLIAHQTNPMIEGWEARPEMKPAWGRLSRYGIGGLAFIPVGRMFFRHFWRQNLTEDEAVDVFTTASIVAFVSITVGVVVGYLLDSLLERIR